VYIAVGNTYPYSGAAVKRERLNLSILQEYLQYIWYEKQGVVLEHCLKENEEEKSLVSRGKKGYTNVLKR